jgi:hypothetical protein
VFVGLLFNLIIAIAELALCTLRFALCEHTSTPTPPVHVPALEAAKELTSQFTATYININPNPLLYSSDYGGMVQLWIAVCFVFLKRGPSTMLLSLSLDHPRD